MKVMILAGGQGTRLAEYTHKVPKPMVEIGDKPMLGHIVDIFRRQAMNNFVIAAGYKKEMIEKWAAEQDFNIRVVDTGQDTLTGGRIKRAGKFMGIGPFIMTYGDGVADINITHVWNYHTTFKPLVTLTAVRPPARFGSLRLDGAGKVLGFHEKSQTAEGWVNGGFMIIENEVLDMIEGDDTNFERDVLPQIAEDRKLQAYFHTGFWQCMDTIRDVELLRQLYDEGAPWIKRS